MPTVLKKCVALLLVGRIGYCTADDFQVFHPCGEGNSLDSDVKVVLESSRRDENAEFFGTSRILNEGKVPVSVAGFRIPAGTRVVFPEVLVEYLDVSGIWMSIVQAPGSHGRGPAELGVTPGKTARFTARFISAPFGAVPVRPKVTGFVTLPEELAAQ